MEDVIWFLVNYPVFLLLVMNICAYWKRDRVTEALAKVIDSRKRIKIDIGKSRGQNRRCMMHTWKVSVHWMKSLT